MLAIAAAITSMVVPSIEREQLFSHLSSALSQVRSLEVEFTREIRNNTFGHTEHYQGTFKLIRDPAGVIRAVLKQARTDGSDQFAGLYIDDRFYILDETTKTALGTRPFAEMVLSLADFLKPLECTVNHTKARKDLRMSISKKDDWYTYLQILPTAPMKGKSWFSLDFDGARVVFMNKATCKIPEHMPRQLNFTIGSTESTFDIRTWRMNYEMPVPEDLIPPEDREGWEVHLYPARKWLR